MIAGQLSAPPARKRGLMTVRHALAPVVLAFFLLACGGDDTDPVSLEPVDGEDATEDGDTGVDDDGDEERGVARADVEACLQDAGVAVATTPPGEAPRVSGVEAIGLLPGSGSLLPGNLGVGVFVFGSEDDAASGEASLESSPFELDVRGNVLLAYAGDVDAATRAQIEACVDG
jgi:hypothetical protein